MTGQHCSIFPGQHCQDCSIFPHVLFKSASLAGLPISCTSGEQKSHVMSEVEVQDDVQEVQEDVQEVQEDVQEVQEDVREKWRDMILLKAIQVVELSIIKKGFTSF